MLYTFCWLIFSMFFALSAFICAKEKKKPDNTVKKTPSRHSSATSKSELPLSKSVSDTYVQGSRPTTPGGTAKTAVKTPNAPTKPGKKSEARKDGKANAEKTDEELKFPSLKEAPASEHTDLDELDDEPNPLMDPAVQEKLRQRWAKNNNKDPANKQADDAKGAKKKSTKRRQQSTQDKSEGPGYLPTVPQPLCASVYVPMATK